jgi:cell division control protein 6
MIVIRKEEFLDPEYLPSEIFHREKEIGQVRVSIGSFLKGRKGDNLFVYGPPGVGKTTTVRHVISNVEDRVAVYVNCWLYRTPHAFLGEIARQAGIPIPRKGKGMDEIVGNIIKKGDMIVVFDEVDKAERIDDIYPLVEKTNSLFIFVTNNRDWILRLEPRVSSRLFLNSLEFRPYDFQQMEDIMKWRVKMAFVPGSLSPDVVTEVARRAYVKKDVRNGLFLLQKISNVCEAQGKKRAEMDVFGGIEEDFKLKPVLTENEKEIVEVIKKMAGETTGSLYSAYRDSGGKLTQRAFRMYLRKLLDKNVLDAKDTGRGFRGRSRRIFLNEKYGV